MHVMEAVIHALLDSCTLLVAVFGMTCAAYLIMLNWYIWSNCMISRYFILCMLWRQYSHPERALSNVCLPRQ